MHKASRSPNAATALAYLLPYSPLSVVQKIQKKGTKKESHTHAPQDLQKGKNPKGSPEGLHPSVYGDLHIWLHGAADGSDRGNPIVGVQSLISNGPNHQIQTWCLLTKIAY